MLNFDEMIENYLRREARQKTIGKYYPSEIGMCIRKIWYSYKFPMPTDAALVKIFELGNRIHEFVMDVLKSEKNPHIDLLESELPFKQEVDDFIISGRIDNLILIKADGRKVLVEVKSTSGIEYITIPPEHNKMQLQLYMHVLKIYDGILLYVDKRDLKSKVFKLPYNEQEAMKTLKKFKELNKCLKENMLPEPEARKKREMWMCRSCEYRDKCYKSNPKSYEIP